MAAPTPPDSLSLAGRTALVTGSSRGLGAATARRLARAGCDVVVTYRRKEAEARAVAAEVEAAGQQAWVQRCDVSKVDEIDALLEAVADPERGPGRLDVLVANAAATSFRPLLDATPRHIERTFAISVTGFLRLVQQAMPMLEASGHGRVVAVSGADTVTWIPAHGILAAAKAAMESMVAYLACEVGERGVYGHRHQPGVDRRRQPPDDARAVLRVGLRAGAPHPPHAGHHEPRRRGRGRRGPLHRCRPADERLGGQGRRRRGVRLLRALHHPGGGGGDGRDRGPGRPGAAPSVVRPRRRHHRDRRSTQGTDADLPRLWPAQPLGVGGLHTKRRRRGTSPPRWVSAAQRARSSRSERSE